MQRTMFIRRAVGARQLLPRDVYFWLKAVLLALVAIQSARLVWAIVTPLGPLGRWLPPAPPTIPATAQIALLSTFDPFASTQAQASAVSPAPAVTGLVLFGTRTLVGAVPASAIIAGTDGVQNSYVVGDEIAPGVRLLSVGFDFVLVGAQGSEQRLVMEGADPPAEAAPVTPQVAGGGSVALTPASLRENVGLAPRLVNGRINGFLVSASGNPAVLNRAGLRDGDVITSVNGRPVTDAAALQSQLSPGASLSLTVERGAGVVPVSVTLEGNP